MKNVLLAYFSKLKKKLIPLKTHVTLPNFKNKHLIPLLEMLLLTLAKKKKEMLLLE